MPARSTSSEAEVLTSEGQASRQPVQIPDREMADIIIEEPTSSGDRRDGQPSAEDAVKAAQRAAEQANARADTEARARQAAESRASQAETRARAGSLAERQSTLKSNLDAAKGKRDSAKAQLRAARDAGDYDAEERALDAMSTAAAEETLIQGELRYLDSQGGGQQTREGTRGGERPADQPAGDQPSQEEVAWVQAHPMFNSDPEYKAAVVGSATEAMNRGMSRGSLAFLDFVNNAMAQRFGDGHGVAGTHGRRNAGQRSDGGRRSDEQPGRRPLSMAMPRSDTRGGGDGYEEVGGGGQRFMDTEFGRVTVESGPEGKPRIRMPQKLSEMWKDAASWMKHIDGKPYTLAEYALEQVQAAEEARAGLDNGLRYDTDNRTYR